MLKPLYWISAITGGYAIDMLFFDFSSVSFLTTKIGTVVVFSRKELRLPKFGEFLSHFDAFCVNLEHAFCFLINSGFSALLYTLKSGFEPSFFQNYWRFFCWS